MSLGSRSSHPAKRVVDKLCVVDILSWVEELLLLLLLLLLVQLLLLLLVCRLLLRRLLLHPQLHNLLLL